MYDWLNDKLDEVPNNVSHKFSHVQLAFVVVNFRSEPLVATTKELEQIRGVKPTIVSCTLPLPTKFMEVLVVVVST
jgi:hypothetical protein